MAVFDSLIWHMLQASTQGLVRELQRQGRAEGARVLCPVPLVTGGLVEPPVVPRFLAALEVTTLWGYFPHVVPACRMQWQSAAECTKEVTGRRWVSKKGCLSVTCPSILNL